jgi:hypothetical protein
MSEKIIKQSARERLYPLSRRAIALGLSIASAAPGIAAAAPKLRELSKLPGAALTVTTAQRQAAKASAVRVNIQLGDNSESCTGNKLNYAGTNYITTAAHCFRFITGSETGLLSSDNGNTAVNFINSDPTTKVSIVDTDYRASKKTKGKSKVVYKTPQPMALANGVSIGMRRGDDALLSIGSATTATTKPAHSRSYDEVPALNYNPAIEPLALGQEVALYGIPAPKFTGVSATGRYLGRMQLNRASPFFETQMVDTIALKAKNDADNPCAPGGSGLTGVSADTHQLGGLTMAVNIGYGPRNAVTHPDPHHSYPGDERHIWLNSEQALGVAVPASEYNELCYFAVRDEQSLPDLIGGFGVFAAQDTSISDYTY